MNSYKAWVLLQYYDKVGYLYLASLNTNIDSALNSGLDWTIILEFEFIF